MLKKTATTPDITSNLGVKQRRKKHILSLNTQQMFSSCIHQKMNPKRKKLEAPYQLEPPIKHVKRAEVQEVVSNLNPKSFGTEIS
jgi:hypothetical protein